MTGKKDEKGALHWLLIAARVVRVAVLVGLVMMAIADQRQALPPSLAGLVLAQPDTPNYDGGIALLDLGAAAKRPEVAYDGSAVAVLGDPDGWYALVGVPLGKPGLHPLLIDGKFTRFEVSEGKFGSSYIVITDKKYTQPLDQADLARIRREQKRIDAARARFDPGEPALPLRLPVRQSIASTPFGFRRYINGELRSSHRGLDLAADTGTPIYSPAAGTVALTGDLFYTGLTVMLAHPAGLTTLYAHMSEILVEEGQAVGEGDLIGKVGSTGRSTGPHLHWGLSLNGVLVDPSLLLSPQSLRAVGLETPGRQGE